MQPKIASPLVNNMLYWSLISVKRWLTAAHTGLCSSVFVTYHTTFALGAETYPGPQRYSYSKSQGMEGNTKVENLLQLGCNTACVLRQRETHLYSIQKKLQRGQTNLSSRCQKYKGNILMSFSFLTFSRNTWCLRRSPESPRCPSPQP